MERHKHFKFMRFLVFLLEAEIHAVAKPWEKWISIVRKKIGKYKHLKFMGFLNISREPEIDKISKTWKSEFT